MKWFRVAVTAVSTAFFVVAAMIGAAIIGMGIGFMVYFGDITIRGF